jgi:hypothetical protein
MKLVAYWAVWVLFPIIAYSLLIYTVMKGRKR